MPSATFTVSKGIGDRTNSILTIMVSGAIDTSNSNVFQDQVMKLVGADPEMRHIRIDLAELTYISSTGISALLQILAALRKIDTDLAIVNTPKHIIDIFDALGFSVFLDFK